MTYPSITLDLALFSGQDIKNQKNLVYKSLMVLVSAVLAVAGLIFTFYFVAFCIWMIFAGVPRMLIYLLT